MASLPATARSGRPVSLSPPRRGLAALVLVPLALLVAAFLVGPALLVIWGSFHDTTTGALTLHNYAFIGDPIAIRPFVNSLVLSLSSTLVGGAFGLLIAQAMLSSRSRAVREIASTFASVAANFAGVPLAFAFVTILGANGLVTKLLLDAGIDIYGAGFKLYSIVGLTVVYSYWQIPLMVLVILPSLEAMRPQWREASEILGASRWDYLRRVAIPVLAPAVTASLLLLFANAFGAFATAYALTTGFVSLVPLEISNLISGNVSYDPGQGDALAVGLAVVMALCIGGRILLERRSARWLRR
jgi:putative spermidine/putrescine transport system permease protein